MSTVLLVGSGGREHALGWKLSQSSRVTRLVVAPGNDGMPESWERWSIAAKNTEDFEKLAQKARGEKIDLAVIGPENPLSAGIVDVFESQGILTFGPSREAARIESSKSFAKEIMKAAGVPTARFFIAEDQEHAENFIKSAPWPPERGWGWVLKADGLAFGKGVKVCSTRDEAMEALKNLPDGRLVIEERLRGRELSWMAFCEGETCSLLEPAQDYKRAYDHDEGPNTGGMGAFSPIQGVPSSWANRVRNEVFHPVLREMKKQGCPFRGLLYAGLMGDFEKDEFWVIEFNSRFGDPEAQVLMPRFSGDLYEWFVAVAQGKLGSLPDQVPFSEKSAVFVMAASRGYPDAPELGEVLEGEVGPTSFQDTPPHFFYSGVSRRQGKLTTSGGRVFGALGVSDYLEEARDQAYGNLRKIRFDGMLFRTDIARGDFR